MRETSDLAPAASSTMANTNLNSSAQSSKSLLFFFLLAFVLSVPLWLLGVIINLFLPMDAPLYTLVSLLWHISLAIIPMITALILVYREGGWNGVQHLLKRPFDYKRIKGRIWYVPIFLLFPVLMLLEYALLKFTGVALPDLLQFSVLLVPVFFVVFFAAGIGEELGWSGYALGPLQDRWSALGASLVLGIASVVWHLVPFLIEPHAPTWILWQSVHAVPLRVAYVWIYNSTGRSMFAVIAFHATVNIGEVVWPFYGVSGYDPFTASILLAITAAIVTFLWGHKTLAQYRFRRNTLPNERL